MSQKSVKSHDRSTTGSGETLAVIREEQFTPTASSVKIDACCKKEEGEPQSPPAECICSIPDVKEKNTIDENEIQKLLKEKEIALRERFNKKLEREIELLKEKFDYILQNEQVRTSYMLCEAHRERKEKIRALQTQLECKNLAGLMYVLCSERRRGKFEKMRMTQDYTEYIEAMQEVLAEAQKLILKLVRGYKTASKIDESWRNKMKNIMKEYQTFVHNFTGGIPETNQYFFDLSKLIKSELPEMVLTEDDPSLPDETPTNDNGEKEDKPWWDMLDGNEAPFVMFGDMAELKAPLKREVLKALKTDKLERKDWQHYAFNDKLLKSKCPNADIIKDEYLKHLSRSGKWDCCTVQPQEGEYQSSASRRMTQASVDIRGNMGSVLRIIASNGYGQPVTKAILLGARDSMEIASTTKLREKRRNSEHNKVVLNIGNKRSSKFEDYKDMLIDYSEEVETLQREETPQIEQDEAIEGSLSALGSIHNDSLHVIPSHVPDQDSKINYEKVCPMESCQRMQVDSFIRSLPPYMRANPYTHLETTFEEYDACSPEELEILKQRIHSKNKKATADTEIEESPLAEWIEESNAVAVQTSDISLSLPSCTCHVYTEENQGKVYNIKELLPVKWAIDEIDKKFFFDSNIEFNRFKVVGQDGDDGATRMQNQRKVDMVNEIRNIFQSQPSLCDIFH